MPEKHSVDLPSYEDIAKPQHTEPEQNIVASARAEVVRAMVEAHILPEIRNRANRGLSDTAFTVW